MSNEYIAEHQRLLMADKSGKLKFYGWNARGTHRGIGAATSKADLYRRMGRKDFFGLCETGNPIEIAILRHTPAIIFEAHTGRGPSPYIPVMFYEPRKP